MRSGVLTLHSVRHLMSLAGWNWCNSCLVLSCISVISCLLSVPHPIGFWQGIIAKHMRISSAVMLAKIL